MKQIKTIVTRDIAPEEFDKQVNAALSSGWVLVKRDVLGAYEGPSVRARRAYYAELEREEFPKEGDVRLCENCRFLDCPSKQEPCHSCEVVNSIPNKWEPAT